MAAAKRGQTKPTTKADSSAERNNDFADHGLIKKIMDDWNGGAPADKLTRQGVAKAIAAGFKLRIASGPTWTAFVEHEFWKRHSKQMPKANDQGNAVKYVIAIHFGEVNRAAKRVSDYNLAVEQLRAEGHEEAEVVKLIRSGPKIAEILARRRQSPKLAKSVPRAPVPLVHPQESAIILALQLMNKIIKGITSGKPLKATPKGVETGITGSASEDWLFDD